MESMTFKAKLETAKNCFRHSMLFFAVVVTILVRSSSSSVDPCSAAIQKGDSRRTTTEDPGVCGGLCDSDIDPTKWYRLDVSNSGARMPESCVPIWSCGTYIPIWLKGAHPTESFPGPVTVKVCAQISNTGDCCEWNSNIDVKWCKDGTVEYFVYKLVTPPYCDMAYCAGNGINCGSGRSWNDILQNCSSTQYPTINADPTLIGPYILKGASTFSLRCTLDYKKSTTDDGSRYDVVFNTTGGVVYTTTLKSTDEPQVVISESYLVGHLDQNVTCRVTAYWQSDYPQRSPYKTSIPVFIGFRFINVKTNSIIANTLPVQEGDKISVRVEPSFPFATNSYSFRIRSSQLYLSSCSMLIMNVSTASFTFSPIANTGYLQRTGYFYIVPDNTIQTQGSIINGYTSSKYMVSILERNWGTCRSTGDPHIASFNGGTFDIQDPGPYILTSFSSRKIEVQVRHNPWYYNPAAYTNCGVIAREGNNIIGIDYCPPQQTPLFIRYVTDVNNKGGYFVSDAFQTNFKTIVLPSGLQIDAVYWEPGHLDLTVRMYGLETDSGVGICSQNPTRVQGTSFFSIKPNTQAPCASDALLVPQCDCGDGGTMGSTCPTPGGNINPVDYSNTCNLPLQNRRKRAATVPSTTTTAAPVESPPLSVTWPTPKKNITEKQAEDACNSALNKSEVFDLCISQLQVNASVYLLSCVLDIQLSEDIPISTRYISTLMEFLCSSVIGNLNDSATMQVLQQQYQTKICPGQCSGNGQCDQGVCRCSAGYISSDCSLSAGTIPTVLDLLLSSCDIRGNSTNDCSAVFITAIKVSDTGLSCKITNTMLDPVRGDLLSIDVNPEVNLGFVLCHLPLLPVSLSLSRDWTLCNYSVNVSLSNDRIHYSNSVVFDVYDSQCNATNTCPAVKGSKCDASRNFATVIPLLFIYILQELIR